MYRILFLLTLLLFVYKPVMAQVDDEAGANMEIDINVPVDHYAPNTEAENPDEAGAAMPNVGISDEKVIVEVVEGVGHIPYGQLAFRDKPSLKGKVLRYSYGAEKVILIGETPEWYKVIMYNNREAYIQKKYVRTTKVFMDETVSTNHMDKTLSIELDYLLDKFEATLKNSNYTKKHQIRPMFKMVDARKNRDVVTLVFTYSCADALGRPIPSFNENELSPYMQQFMDIILGRLILAPADEFKIVIKTPTYDEKGRVINYSKDYAVISLNPKNVNMEEVRSKNISILSLAESTIPVNDLFKMYPR